MHRLMLLRNGHVVTEGWWAPYGPDRVHLLYSLSKSFTSTAAGFAVAEGLLDLDRTVLSYFPEFDADVTDERSRSILVRHVAAMASGHHTETIEQAMANDPAEPVRGFLMIPPEHEPGSWFAYNQPCTYALAAIVQRESGQRLVDYLRPRLFDPLGIGPVGWQQHPPGRDLGFTGLHATHRRDRQARPALPAARLVGRPPAAARGLGRRGDRHAGRQPARGEPGLAPGLRLPVLDGPARLPRRRGVRAVLRGAARARRRGGDHRCVDRHAGRARTGCGRTCCPRSATTTARARTGPPRTCTWRVG